MTDDRLIQQYKKIISTYIEKGDERSLYEVSGFARACLAQDLGPEILVEMHSSILSELVKGRDTEVRELVARANQVLLEAMMTYGLVYQELLERKSGEYKTLEAYTKKIEKQAEQLRTLYNELEISNAGTVALYKELDDKNRELQEANVRLQELDRLKSQFLASMSHELRTPLNSIMGFTGIILQGYTGELNDEQKKQLGMVYDSAKHLLGLINDVLDLSKIAAGRMEVVPEPFDFAELIDSVREMVTPIAASKGLKLVTNVPQSLEVYTDKNKAKQILINLLNNALKFTELGQVEITCGVSTDGQNIEVSVADTGIGIQEEDMAYIFDEFRQVEGTVVKERGGTGLGLSISKKLVDLLGGAIWAESQYGVGSKFTFSLPLAAAPLAEPVVAARRRRKIDATKRLILTIEDDPKAQELLRIYLEWAGYQVVQAYHGSEAIQLARELKPFAITLDIIMPGKDGWDILQELKSTPETTNTPVIIVSIVDSRELGLSLGALAYLVKPVERDELLRTLNSIEKENGIKIKSVLVVDDNPHDVEFMAAALEDPTADGRTVLKAYGGVEGIRKAKKHLPDLIILDLMMPDMDGFEVIKMLRRHKTTRSIPIMIVTGKELTEEERAFLRENIQHIMVKGDLTKEQLLQEVKSILVRLAGESPHERQR